MRLSIAALASPALAAYVQWQYCNGYDGNADLVLEGLSAHLERHDSATRMGFQLLERTTQDNCDSISSNLNAAIDITLLGRSIAYSMAAHTICSAARWVHNGDNKSALLGITLSTDVDILYPLSTFHLDLRLVGQNPVDEIECISADVTPEFSPMAKMILRLVPAVAFLIVLIIGCFRTIFDVPDDTAEGRDGSVRLKGRPVLPGVSDCLYHLQFVFFTGALSLRYPGFYQPAVSYLNWFSLLTNSNALTKGVTYPSVSDGIYEINGTYGGTYGLEIMTQIVGAPMTMDLWVNMVILIIFISIVVAVLLEIHWFFNRGRQIRYQEEQGYTGFRRVASQVLRSVLSYFLLPLVALSAYQLDSASILPAYHTTLAVGLIIVIVLAFLWLLQQLPVRNLGVLIVDRSKAYQPVSSTSYRDDSFVLSFFVLTFIRGIAIGGLQLASMAQLAVLIVSEILSVVCIAAFNPDSIVSTGSTCAVSRVVTLLLMIAFLPGLASLPTKSIIGYALLFQQTIVLLCVILLPSICRLIQLCRGARTAEDRPVYTLRQLRRRRTRNSINQEQYPDTISHGSGAENSPNTTPISAPMHRDRPRDPRIDSLSISSRYYRPPRSSSHSPSTLRPGSQPMNDTRPAPSSSIGAESEAGRDLDSSELGSSTQSLSSRSTTPNLSDSASSTQTPLGPRWGDYSFREVDLVYGRPPEQSSCGEPIDLERRLYKRHVSNRSIFSIFLDRPGSKQKGFEVDRPRNSS